MSSPARSPWLIGVLVFGSGFAALVYEVVWVRELSLVLGKSTYSISIILASFMGGIALGNIVFGRIADRLRRPLLVFGLLESCIGVAGLLLLLVFAGLNPFYRWVITGAGASIDSPLALALKPTISFVVLTVQTLFMGGTLPVLVKHVVRRADDIGSGVGVLYALNTGGAVVGCFAAGFILLPEIGGTAAVSLMALVNVSIGATAVMLGRRAPVDPKAPSPAVAPPRAVVPGFYIVAYFATGLCALGYEILWSRQLVFVVGPGAYAFTLMLTTFLLGLALGSALYAQRFVKVRDQFKLFGLVQVGIGVAAALGIATFYNLTQLEGMLRVVTGASSWVGVHAVKGIVAVVLMILPTALFGLAFPLVNRLYIDSVGQLGRGIALLTAVNGLGGITGSFLAAYLLLPALGIHASIGLLASLNLALGAYVLWLRAAPARRAAMMASAAAVLLVALSLWLTAKLPPAVVTGESFRRRVLLFYHEGVDATLSVLESERGSRLLDINGDVTAADTFTDVVVHKLLGHLPMIMHPDPKDSLVVGFGLGITARAQSQHPEARRVDIIELVEREQDTARFFEAYNRNVLADPKVNLVIGDGRDWIGTTAQHYDVISFNAVHPRLGAALYTREFYELCRDRLNPGGIVAGWVPTNWMSRRQFESLLRTFADAFPHASLWYVNTAHTVIIGGVDPITYDFERVRQRLATPPIHADLEPFYLSDPISFVSFFLMGPEALRLYAGDAPINTDTSSSVEYSRRLSKDVEAGIIESIIAAREPIAPHLRSLDEQTAAALGRAYDGRESLLMGELLTWQYAQPAASRGHLENAVAAYPEDPYVRFIASGYGAAEAPAESSVVVESVEPIYRGDPATDPRDWFNRGSDHLAAGEHAEAAGALEIALSLEPDHVPSYNNLGLTRAALGDLEAAAAAFERSISLKPHGWRAHYHLGNLHLARGDEAAALEMYRAAVARNPYYVKALDKAARLEQTRGDAAAAEALRVRAFAADPHYQPN